MVMEMHTFIRYINTSHVTLSEQYYKEDYQDENSVTVETMVWCVHFCVTTAPRKHGAAIWCDGLTSAMWVI